MVQPSTANRACGVASTANRACGAASTANKYAHGFPSTGNMKGASFCRFTDNPDYRLAACQHWYIHTHVHTYKHMYVGGVSWASGGVSGGI